ncbi:uncharacterized protein BCR38DRAFT_508607 [Pseudomassariella vexata]|uniref:Uncharacterized protein n=1 Tax=Pseudomassariella vexata TaxID=1141098 RepID=A0A1Y2EC42_9PEZI|nr:uncharacterized protein BCR38DRAFT_508607 [Pseudomassariella vexata]ORY69112.1 hypothetical protein BCR38DRAFT_508607 [Pseudomassariella vexata]
MGTGKLVPFETNYGTNYDAIRYPVFIFLAVSGEFFGDFFCQANFFWSRQLLKYGVTKNQVVHELMLVMFIAALLQFPNPMIQDTRDIAISNLLADCRNTSHLVQICVHERKVEKGVPSGIIIDGRSQAQATQGQGKNGYGTHIGERPCPGYLPEAELEFGLGLLEEDKIEVDLLEGPISEFVNRTPLTICAKTPMEFVVGTFGKLMLEYAVVVEEDTARVVGAIIAKRLVSYIDGLK